MQWGDEIENVNVQKTSCTKQKNTPQQKNIRNLMITIIYWTVFVVYIYELTNLNWILQQNNTAEGAWAQYYQSEDTCNYIIVLFLSKSKFIVLTLISWF